jgi:trehalose 6-phosphate phosphatase
MAKPKLFFGEGWSRTGPGFFARTPRLLSLDFDGTLAEIAPTPQAAWMSEAFRDTLKALSLLPQTKLVLLSGRSVPDLKRKVRLPGLVYVGNHGLNFSPPAAGWGTRSLKQWSRKTREARKRLQPVVGLWPGSLLETKGPDLSLHYRRLKLKQVRRLIPQALRAIEDLPLAPRRGKGVLELKPKGAPGKGRALDRLASRFFPDPQAGVCVHVGDDATDEEAFRALRRMSRPALGLKVGPGPTRAHYRLKDLEEVHGFLSLFLCNQPDFS